MALPGFIDYQPIRFYRDVMDLNFFAPVLLTQRLLSSIRKTRGRIVIVSSVDGLVSLPGNAPYDASKFAVEAYADALRAELSFWRVSVSVINPSTMRTPMSMGFFAAHRRAWREMERIDPDGAWKGAWPQHWLEEYVELNTRQLERIAEDPARAIRDIVHAVTARRPRLRYLSGTLAKTLFYALWIGPESWSLRFKRVMIQPPPPVELP
jgi:short-subunit dehydrogenase